MGAMNAPASPAATPSQRSRKPDWIRVKAPTGPGYAETRKLMRELNLHTVCEEAACPNIGECWTKKHATVMILGDTCTRACAFCNVKTGMPRPVDLLEPEHMQRFDGADNGHEFELPLPEGSTQPLEKCLGELPDAQRVSVHMFYYEDKSYKEIADTINEELGKVRSFIQNGRRNLKLCLERHGIRALNDNRI